tara:strand:- start:51133 stop:52212 length:1080 start_codon:yes stop_codon:yes gene_type:complete
MAEFPTVTNILCTPLIAPLARPMRTASGTLPGAALALIDIETDAGITGSAYIFGYTPKTLRALSALLDDIKDIAIGGTIAPKPTFDAYQSGFRLLGVQGLMGMLISGIDMALWDALGKFCDQPVCRLLGADPVPLRAYDSYGVVDPATDRALLEESLSKGFQAIKIKLGVGSLADDMACVAGVREIIGDDVQLMIDYNQSLSAPDAIRRIEHLAAFDIAWLEEPVPSEDLAGHRQICQQSPVPVQTGENWWFPAGAANALAADASDLMMPDIMKIGGFSGWMQVAGMAAGANMPISSHLFVEASAHALAATPTCHWLEHLDIARPILTEPYDVVDGCITARGPGLGIAWDMAAVEKYAL